MKVAFEHEFLVKGLEQVAHPAFSVSSGRNVSHLANQVMGTLGGPASSLSSFRPNMARTSFEISTVPCDPLLAVDRAIPDDGGDPRQRAATRSSRHIPAEARSWRCGKRCAHPLQPLSQRQTRDSGEGLGDGNCGRLRPGILDHAETVLSFSCLSTNSYLRFSRTAGSGPMSASA